MNSDGMDTSAAQPSWDRRVNNGKAAQGLLDGDAELMLQVRAGDEACFTQLLERHRSAVIHFLYRMVQDQAVAEELQVPLGSVRLVMGDTQLVPFDMGTFGSRTVDSRYHQVFDQRIGIGG
jgi:hypothetical protein